MVKHKKDKKKPTQSKSGKNRTPIGGHSRQGSELLPPFAKMERVMSFFSWKDDRLPEMIWAALIRVAVDQKFALGQFRRILNFVGTYARASALHDLTLSGISKLEDSPRDELIAFVIDPPEVAQVLVTLRLFQSLPAREAWDRLLPDFPPDPELLMRAVGATLWHQSQESTDCRWLRLMAKVITGKFHIPKEIADEWLGYPNEGDQRKVRPSIRAAEVAENPLEPPDLTWPKAFWDEAWKNTPCLALVQKPALLSIGETVTRQRLNKVMDLLTDHWNATHKTTAIDAKHDAVFGMAFYALRILEELLGIGVGTTVLGRLGLRTILEVHINLRYLLNKDDGELWKKWRTYGAGQAKLNALKFDDALEPPKHIDIETIEQIAGEDLWEEFLKINLASWSGLDLRRLSECADLKDTYDRHYSWTSGYAHGTWGPIRESCYQTSVVNSGHESSSSCRHLICHPLKEPPSYTAGDR